jgi:hypothetical protein
VPNAILLEYSMMMVDEEEAVVAWTLVEAAVVKVTWFVRYVLLVFHWSNTVGYRLVVDTDSI